MHLLSFARHPRARYSEGNGFRAEKVFALPVSPLCGASEFLR